MRVLILALLFLPFSAWTQEYRKCPNFNLEENWENSDSFVKNEKVIWNLLEWLNSTPPSEQLLERSAAGIFVMNWVTKNPNLLLQVEVGPYNDYLFNEDLMLGYLFGCIHYALKHTENAKSEAKRLAGLKSLLLIVEHSESYSKNKIFKALLRANRKGELAEFDKAMWMNHKTQALLPIEKLK
jgi:hypothetical protein